MFASLVSGSDSPFWIHGDVIALAQPLIPYIDSTPEAAFPIVGIGASAGGLEAFTELLAALPVNTGMAFVLIQHLDPEYKSRLAEILSRATAMPVHEVAEGEQVKPNHVYVIPSKSTLTIASGALRLSPRPASPQLHLPVDLFFASLAESHGSQAIGVILSGTASDGARGVRAIKEHFGITFAQDEQSAKYSGMPHSAIVTDAIDFVLPPSGIASELGRLSVHPSLCDPSGLQPDESSIEDIASLHKIVALLDRGMHVNFARYQQASLRRRIGRRMTVHRCETLRAYLQYLNEHPEELKDLYNDILINLTSFFRDAPVFEVLANRLRELLRDRAGDDPIRVWVPGCATGEETYSIAMCIDEVSREQQHDGNMQLFGTDISESALDRARAGVYPDTIASTISPERLQRYFTTVDAGYKIRRFIRDACIFSRQDVTVDPPFSRLDLVSCRNLLIYLGPSLHRTVLPMFHYSLNPDGLLLLGSAETVGPDADLFQAIDEEHKIYRRKATAGRRNLPFPTYRNPVEPSLATPAPRTLSSLELQKKTDRAAASHYAPDGVVVNEDFQIVQFRGHTGFYLEPASGEASLDLLRLARASLQPALRRIVDAAMKKGQVAREEGVRVQHGGELHEINLEVIPIAGSIPRERYFLIVFERPTPAKAAPLHRISFSGGDAGSEALLQRIDRLELDLSEAREYLNTTAQEHEAALEELRAAGEEAASSNEELHSTNEELATAKEELQSTNEELNTVNEELQYRNQELNRLYNDLENLLAAVKIPIIMVDHDLRLRRFTPVAEQWLSLRPADIGQPLSHVLGPLSLPHLPDLARKTLDELSVQTTEFEDHAGSWWSLSIRPYRTVDHRIEGAVLTFIDVSAVKRSLLQAEQGMKYAGSVIEAVRQPLVVLTADHRVESANQAFFALFRISPQGTIGRLLHDLAGNGREIPQLRQFLQTLLETSEYREIQVEHRFPTIGTRTMTFSGRQIVSPERGAKALLLAVEDVTARQNAAHSLSHSNQELERFAHIVAHDLQEPLRNVGSLTQLLERRYGVQGDSQELVQRVSGAVARMHAMINDLLEYSHVTTVAAGVLSTCQAGASLEQAVGNLQETILQTAATITNDELPEIRYHPQQLTQIFQNLIGNALKYRRAEPPRIHISAQSQDGKWLFSVRDNGMGFHLKDAERIFDIFKRLHGQEYPGTGMGLAICARTVQLHGGRIWAESELGQGSTFFFTLLV